MPLAHRGFSAWIICDGEQVVEQDVTIDAIKNEVSCWIQAEAGKKFIICWQDHDSGIDTCSYITVDGLNVPGRFLLGQGIAVRSGARASDTTERPFIFRDVDDGSNTGDVSGDAGIIILKIKRVKRIDSQLASPLQSLSVLGKRKHGQVCPGLGEQEYAFHRQPTTYKVIPYEDGLPAGSKPITFVTFVFRYRPPGSVSPVTQVVPPSSSIPSISSPGRKQTKPISVEDLDLERIANEVVNNYYAKTGLFKRQKLDEASPASDSDLANNTIESSTPSSSVKLESMSPKETESSGATTLSKESSPTSDVALTSNGTPSLIASTSSGSISMTSSSSSGTLSTNASPSPIIPTGPLSANPYMYTTYYMNGLQPGIPMIHPGYTYASLNGGFNTVLHPHYLPYTATLPNVPPLYIGTPFIASGPTLPNNMPSAPHIPSRIRSTVRRPTAPPATHPVGMVASGPNRAASESDRMVQPSVGRSSPEFKRAASWAAVTTSSTLTIGPYNGQFDSDVPRHTLQSSTLMNMATPDDYESSASESPET